MPLQTALQHLGVAKETTWGTGVVPAKYIPVNDVKFENVWDSVDDDAKRGNLTGVYNVVRTTKKSTLDIDTNFYTNELGYYFLALFGKDTVSGTSPYTHKFQVDPTARSLTQQFFDGMDEQQFAGCVVDEINVKGDAEGIITVSIKTQGKFGSTVTTTTATIDTTIKPLVGAFASLTIDAGANTNLFSFDITFKRNNKLIFGANNSADPTKVVQGTISTEFKLLFDVENSAEYTKFTDGLAHVYVLTLGGSANSNAKITITAGHVKKSTRDNGEEDLRVELEGIGVYNTTDAGPCVVEVTNTTATY
jgi:hypothetical protein